MDVRDFNPKQNKIKELLSMDKSGEDDSSDMVVPMVIGIVIAILFLLLMILIFYCLRCKKKIEKYPRP